jgi:hypothetical protein
MKTALTHLDVAEFAEPDPVLVSDDEGLLAGVILSGQILPPEENCPPCIG